MEHGTSEVLVTEATQDDVAAFAAFFWEAWREAGPDAPGFAGATDDVITELTTPEAIRQRIGGPERRMFLAWETSAGSAFLPRDASTQMRSSWPESSSWKTRREEAWEQSWLRQR